MNLNQIDPKNFIMALIKRDDNERILLGMGLYEFKDDLQHFQPNIIANDVVEKQGANGQLLAGQVLRGGTQSFDGYVGDETVTRQDTEDARRNFLRFFQPNHFYTAIYIMPNGDAIQRRNGYLVDAPSIPEQYERFPEYHVALAFEDLNYYTYDEDASGNEIYAQVYQLEPEGQLTGGLVWDAIGVEWEDITTATYTGTIITQSAIEGPLKFDKIDGDTYQQSYTGKNLLNFIPVSSQGMTVTYDAGTGLAHVSGTNSSSDGKWANICQTVNCLLPAGTYTLSVTNAQSNMDFHIRLKYQDNSTGDFVVGRNSTSKTFTTPKDTKTAYIWYGGLTPTYSSVDFTIGIQLEAGSAPTSFEPYVGGIPAPNPVYPQAVQTVTGVQTVTINGTAYQLDLGNIQLCRLGDYQDYIWKDGEDWKAHKDTGVVVYDGSNDEGWSEDTSGIYSRKVITIADSLNVGATRKADSLSDHFRAETVNDYGIFFRNNKNAYYYPNSDITTVEEWRAWLSSNNINTLYPLATPTDTIITDANLINQLEAINNAATVAGTNTITVTASGINLPGPITVELPTSGGGAVWDAESGHATTTLNVGGLLPVNPVWIIPGPAESPIIENITNGTSLSFLGDIPAGQSLIIDSSAQTATLAGANVKNNVRGTWQTFDPGQVIIRYSGANITGPSTIEWNEVVE